VCLDCPPDGRTRIFYDDGGEEAPPDTEYDRRGVKVLIGINPDEI
jgi:hypothetical protein